MVSDSLLLDRQLLDALRNDSRYDYDRELVGGSQNLLEWLSSLVTEWLQKHIGVAIESDVTYYVLLVVGLLLIVLLAWLVWRRRHVVFSRKEKESLDFVLENDSIYGIDFETDIAQMRIEGNWRQAVRLVYLQTLRRMSDARRIDWQPAKTPAQYAVEADLVPFTELSLHFVRVRYGNFPADESLYQLFRALQTDIDASLATKGGDA